jgi:small subunit ribosomal protein S24e
LELKILEERSNPLLKRTEYRFEISHPGAATPKLEEVRGELAKLLKLPKDRLVIEGMHARFGTPQTRGEALAYLTAEDVKAISREHILIRNKLKEKPVPATPGAAEAPAAVEAKPAAETKPAHPPAAAEEAKHPAAEAKKPAHEPKKPAGEGKHEAEGAHPAEGKHPPAEGKKGGHEPKKAAADAKKE